MSTPATTHKNVAVVGGAGFLGRALVDKLHRQGHHPHVLDRADALRADPPRHAASHHSVSIEDSASLHRALEAVRPDVVVDLAYLVGAPAEDDIALATTVNLLGPMNVMRAADHSGATRYVQAGSIAVYGHDDAAWDRPVTETDMAPLARHSTAYGAFKCVNEFQAARFAQQTGLEVSVVRLSILVGPGRARGLAGWPSALLDQAVAGHTELAVPVPAAAHCQILAVDDAAELMMRVSVTPETPPAVINSGGHDVSAREFVTYAAELFPGIRATYDESASGLPFVHRVAGDLARTQLAFVPSSPQRTVRAAGLGC